MMMVWQLTRDAWSSAASDSRMNPDFAEMLSEPTAAGVELIVVG